MVLSLDVNQLKMYIVMLILFQKKEWNSFEDSNKNNSTLHVPASSVELYKAADGWKDFKNIVAIEE